LNRPCRVAVESSQTSRQGCRVLPPTSLSAVSRSLTLPFPRGSARCSFRSGQGCCNGTLTVAAWDTKRWLARTPSRIQPSLNSPEPSSPGNSSRFQTQWPKYRQADKCSSGRTCAEDRKSENRVLFSALRKASPCAFSWITWGLVGIVPLRGKAGPFGFCQPSLQNFPNPLWAHQNQFHSFNL
jgi:hypothetical protein